MMKKLSEAFRYKRPAYTTSARKQKAKVENPKGTLLRIWHYMLRERRLLFSTLAMIIVSSILALVGPVILGHIVDRFVSGEYTAGYLLQQLSWLLLIYSAVAVMTFLQGYWMITISQTAVYSIRKDLFVHLQKLKLAFFDKRQHGELMSRMTNDVDNISTTLNTSMVQIVSSIITFIGILAVMVILSPVLTIITLLVVPIMFIGIKWITNRTRHAFRTQQQAVSKVNGYAEESISGQAVIKAYAQESKVIDTFCGKTEELQHAGFWAQTFSGFIPKWMNMLNNISFAVIAGVGALLIGYGRAGITVGTIVIFLEYSRQFTRPLNDLANQFNSLFSALAGAERVFGILDEQEEHQETAKQTISKLRGDIHFENVTFTYEGEPALKNISFSVQSGQMAAFVGPTGSGKTTIMNLIAGFYQPDKGQVTIDDMPLPELDLSSYRNRIGVVLQQDFLFKGTILENIRYGKLDATDDQVIEAAQAANAHRFITRLPDGYETIVGQDGGGLSHGQRQLLSIAKALLKDPDILLLDEATSSIDTITELRIQQAMKALMKGRTSIVVAHRLNTIEQADKIFVLQDGEIKEQGSHHELIEQKGFYSALQNEKKQHSSTS
ncbi:ABC transporter ATP-binding protein [Terribacillus saccharophilus]|uniref:Multidrug ABC transporter ATP-binding protein n=1 Tax=Terribacillus saccharophilus TaxID=361277 RepID=A0A268ADI4_9BACI|nr:ABC transporter ATP-binding protein [Terribacillus saccharophilus]PAD22175.1 multidrug ABC transporter ATP-binding protein [Terribacillus saccharophilus]